MKPAHVGRKDFLKHAYSIYLRVLSFKKYLLHAYYVPTIVLGAYVYKEELV